MLDEPRSGNMVSADRAWSQGQYATDWRTLQKARVVLFLFFLSAAAGNGVGRDGPEREYIQGNAALARFERTKAQKPGEPNPRVVGMGEDRKYLTVVEECARF